MMPTIKKPSMRKWNKNKSLCKVKHLSMKRRAHLLQKKNRLWFHPRKKSLWNKKSSKRLWMRNQDPKMMKLVKIEFNLCDCFYSILYKLWLLRLICLNSDLRMSKEALTTTYHHSLILRQSLTSLPPWLIISISSLLIGRRRIENPSWYTTVTLGLRPFKIWG